MSNEHQNLLDLCRLNQIRDTAEQLNVIDRDETLKAIDWKARRLAEKVRGEQPPVAPGVMEKHIKREKEAHDLADKELKELAE